MLQFEGDSKMLKISATADHDEWNMIQHRSTEDRLQKKRAKKCQRK